MQFSFVFAITLLTSTPIDEKSLLEMTREGYKRAESVRSRSKFELLDVRHNVPSVLSQKSAHKPS